MTLPSLRQWRLGAGLVLFTYVSTHLLNHALGLISLAAMQEGQVWFLRLWRNPLGTVALYGALIVHALLALWFLYERRTLRMPAWQATQIGAGALHSPAPARPRYGNADGVRHVRHRRAPTLAFSSSSGSSPGSGAPPGGGPGPWCGSTGAWGFTTGFASGPWYPRAGCGSLPSPCSCPCWLSSASSRRARGRPPRGPAGVGRRDPPRGQRARARPSARPWPACKAVMSVYGGTLGAVLLARGIRALLARRRTIRIAYPSGRTVQVAPGFTVLEASRNAGIPHASVCGGRGRCSTCRIRIVQGLQPCPLRAPTRCGCYGGSAPPRMCGWPASSARRVTSASSPCSRSSRPPARSTPGDEKPGREQEVVVLFADLRGFTRLAEHKLPYDVVFLLNRYFEVVGTAIETGGRHRQPVHR